MPWLQGGCQDRLAGSASMDAATPVREIAVRIRALIFLVDLFLWSFKFHLGTVFKIMKLE